MQKYAPLLESDNLDMSPITIKLISAVLLTPSMTLYALSVASRTTAASACAVLGTPVISPMIWSASFRMRLASLCALCRHLCHISRIRPIFRSCRVSVFRERGVELSTQSMADKIKAYKSYSPPACTVCRCGASPGRPSVPASSRQI